MNRKKDRQQHMDSVDPHMNDYLDIIYDRSVTGAAPFDPVQISHGDGPLLTETSLDGTGDAAFGMRGDSPKNETGNRELCIILAESMTRVEKCYWAADPERPKGPERGADWIVRSGTKSLDVQVTRVNPQQRWADLGRTGAVMGGASRSNSIEEIWAAIERKLLAQDRTVILALDARYPGFHCTNNVVNEFRYRYESELKKLRFAQVWLIGLNADLSFRLAPAI